MRADDDIDSVWDRPGFLVRRLHQISVAIFADEMGDLGITPVQFGTLSVIAANPGIDQAALGAALGIDRANVADVVLRLVTHGYVVRQPSETDRRVKKLFLTPPGEEVRGRSLAKLKHVQSRLLQPLDPHERENFVNLLSRLIDENNALSRAPLVVKRQPGSAAAMG